MITNQSHTSVFVLDQDSAKAFYSEKLGFELEKLRELVASGTMGVGVLATEDCHRTYEELSAKGVTFLSPPPNDRTALRPPCGTTPAT
jgi:catechol 2,3-dioxygenase-like lactoylglutathione lyase family enzyme